MTIRATVLVRANGQRKQAEKRFPVGTSAGVIAAWKASAKRALERELGLDERSTTRRGSLADDLAVYLASVTAMPSYEARRADAESWLPRFGQRDRLTIDHRELAAQINEWAEKGVAASTINHRRHALNAVYRFHDPDAPTPIAKTQAATPPPLQARALPWADVLAIVDALPISAPAAVLRVMAFTGFPQARIGRLRLTDLKRTPTGGIVFLEGRRKGSGTASKSLPLTPAGIDALARHFRHYPNGGICSKNAWAQTFRGAVARVNAQRARDREDPIPVGARPYDLRHSFGTYLYELTGDLKAVAEALDVSLETAERYTLGAVSARVNHAISKLSEALASA